MADSQTELQEGDNNPSVINQVICLGWYDGPVAGLLRLAKSGQVYRFELIDPRQQSDYSDERAYALFPLPGDAFDNLVNHLQETHEPKWPIWVPVWTFPTEELQ